MLNSQLFLALSTLRYKRLRLRTIGFIVLTLAMALTTFGCSFPGSSTPPKDEKPCPDGYNEYTDPNTGQKQCVQGIKGEDEAISNSSGGY